MIGSFSFNGVESSSFGLVCKSVKRSLLPAVKLKRVESNNVSGVYDTLDNEYSLRTLSMRITYIGTSYEELRTRARSIAAWLSTPTWGILLIHDEPDKYYLAKVTEELDLSSMWEAGEVEVTFDCQPFAYGVAEVGEVFENITTGFTCKFTNPGTRVINYKSPQGSKFLIAVIGSWTTLSLTMGGVTLGYNYVGTSDILIIDNIEMEATLNGANVFSSLSGSVGVFLAVVPGDNDLIIGGSGLDIDVTVNFIPLWI